MFSIWKKWRERHLSSRQAVPCWSDLWWRFPVESPANVPVPRPWEESHPAHDLVNLCGHCQSILFSDLRPENQWACQSNFLLRASVFPLALKLSPLEYYLEWCPNLGPVFSWRHLCVAWSPARSIGLLNCPKEWSCFIYLFIYLFI
jgi:hypothetical protein